jgi:hypothetical protein
MTISQAALEASDLAPDDVPEGVGVLARGMRDNPIHVAALGPDPDRRERLLHQSFGRMFRVLSGEPICVRRDGRIVAVTGVLTGGACRPSAGQTVRMAPGVLTCGPRTAVRTLRWLKAWDDQHPEDPHAHLGPLSVDRHLQGQGIGTVLLAEHCRRLDESGTTGYLETDKPENVRFYARQGYEVVAEAPVIGVPNWFMVRAPR